MKRPTQKEGDSEICYKPNEPEIGFGGIATDDLQVLKSNAGYYIGALCFEYEMNTWIPNFRDSKFYYKTREQAENLLITGNYEVSF